MEKEKLSYYVVIPMPVFSDKGLSKTEKLLYGLISSLANNEGYCYANNEYLANKMDIKDNTTISKLLKNIEKKGHIKIVLVKDGAIVKKRKIYLNSRMVKTPTDEWYFDQNTVGENAKESNKTIKGISKYIKEINKESFFENNDLNETFKEYLKMRYEKKCKATETTIDRLIKKLNKKDIDTAIAMLNYSIENGYQGVFELKKDKPYQQEIKEKVPEWFDKEIEIREPSAEEKAELENILREFSE